MTKKTFIISFSIIAIFGLCGLVQASEVEGTISTGVESGVGSMDGVVKAAPTASPVAGTYTSTQSVSLTAAGSTAICYTTDSTTPACATSTTCTTGTKYSSAVSVSSTTTIKSIACYADASSGPVSTDTYTISTGSGSSTPPPSGTTPPTTTATTPTSTTGEVTATVSEGGIVSRSADDGGQAEANLPADALSADATVTIIPTEKILVADSHPAPSGKTIAGDYVYNFTAVSGTTSITSFNKATTITFTYTDAQVAGLNEGSLKIYYWDDASSQWIVLADSSVDAAANTITATTTHFTYFAIMETEEPAAEIVDGDIIQCQNPDNPFAVYIVKIVSNTFCMVIKRLVRC